MSAAQPAEGERVTVYDVEPRKTDDGILYFTCPVCNCRIREGFSSQGGPIPYTHIHQNRRNCRLVIDIDPTGTDHEIVEVRAGVSQEAIVRRRQDHPDRLEGSARAALAELRRRADE